MKILPRNFYQRDTVEVAKDLLGKIIVREITASAEAESEGRDGEKLAGIITEVEAYRSDDEASHSFIGKTKRNEAMFGPVGHCYIYFIYGNHYCLNFVARDSSVEAGGVLIRALKSLHGIELMKKFRNQDNVTNLTNGPGKLAQALKITKEFYGHDITKKGKLYVIEGIEIKSQDIITTPRIGIKKAIDKPWRFLINL